ncbi:unnamed protein product [Phyllotreta striolata]|uniref:Crossover junction endonuclease MUS81 n=1 Tax=Phyllotreta striolata TaxID=444603 RepID=A0A9N9XUM7_PHYSR|nr:unnamed protein product [Phyllotreta striolata]
MAEKRRISLKYKSANPLFEKWLSEWKIEAEHRGSKRVYAYKNALTSLKKCPISFNTGQECKILKGFGDQLCRLLDQKLRDHRLQEDRNSDSDNREEQLTGTSCSSSVNVAGPSSTNNIDAESKNTGQTNRTNKKAITKTTSSESAGNSQQSVNSLDDEFYILEPGSFDIILCVDTAETTARSSDPLITELTKQTSDYQFEVKKLHIGDYVWICRDRTTKKELVLPYVMERKRMDDFARSIMDGRYHEQKFRLKNCGLEHKYYLIENHEVYGFSKTSLKQAEINTTIQDGFKIQYTLNLKHTARFLGNFTLLLKSLFSEKTLVKCPKENLATIDLSSDLISLMSFQEFNQGSVKNKPMKVSDLFIKMLIQMQGMSVKRAIAITQRYPTPVQFRDAIDESCREDFQKQLAELSYQGQKVGSTLRVPYIPRKMICSSKPTMVVTKENEEWTITTSTLLKSTVLKFRIGEEYEESMPGGVLKVINKSK